MFLLIIIANLSLANAKYRNFENNISSTYNANETFNTKAETLYPVIAFERRQLMNWDNEYLMKTYNESGKNKNIFLQMLRKEFARSPKVKVLLNLSNNSEFEVTFANAIRAPQVRSKN